MGLLFCPARYIFGDATGDAVADRIREALELASTEGLTRTGLSELFRRLVSSARIVQALAQLVGCGLAEPSRRETRGRMTTREIQGHLEEMYQVEVSPALISTVTDAVLDEVKAW